MHRISFYKFVNPHSIKERNKQSNLDKSHSVSFLYASVECDKIDGNALDFDVTNFMQS